jgi:RNA polymerase sigma-70 factor (ECF subfamily)
MTFEDVIEQHHDEIFRFLWRLMASSPGGAATAEDLTQEVFLRAYRAYARLQPDSNVRAWLYRIATNCAYTALKRVQREDHRRADLPDADDTLLPDPLPLPHDQVASGETLDVLRRAIGDLPPKQQAALVMRYLQDIDYADIAAALECSKASARANVYQAIQRLRRDLALQGVN